MSKYLATALVSLLITATASAAPGDKVIENQNLNKDLLFNLNINGSPRQVLKLSTSTTTASGSWSISNSSGLTLQLAKPSTGGPSLGFEAGAFDWSLDVFPSGGAFRFMNNAGSLMGEISQVGGWNLGDQAAGIGNNYHNVNGSVRMNIASTGRASIASTLVLDLGNNIYQDQTGAVRAIGTVSGYTQARFNRPSSDTTKVFQVFANQDSQTAGAPIVSTNEYEVFSVTALGSALIGRTGHSGVHTINGFIRITGDDGAPGGSLNAISFGAGNPGFYSTFTNGGGAQSCTSVCSSSGADAGFVGGHLCLNAWTSANASIACGTATANGKCLCMAID